jgi:hypothetical protein
MMRREQKSARSFGEQYRAINSAFSSIREEPFELIGFLDADIGFKQPEYLSTVLQEFERDPSLGIAGGYLIDVSKNGEALSRFNSPDTVPGGVQVFRRRCFIEAGTYVPLEFGGSDSLAELCAKRLQWVVRAIDRIEAYHYRPTSSAGGSLKGAIRYGMMDANFGNDLIFEFLKCVRRATESPWKMGGVIRLFSYFWFFASLKKSDINIEDRKYLQYLQRQRRVARNLVQGSISPVSISRKL